MFTKILLKSIASTAAAGAVVAMAQVAGPAAVTASPTIENVACSTSYQGCAHTNADVDVDHQVTQYGTFNTITVTVHNTETGGRIVGGGHATVIIRGVNTRSVQLTNGRGTLSVPRRLDANQTYDIVVQFPSQGQYGRSTDITRLTVVKSRTDLAVRASDLQGGQRPVVTGSVTGRTGLDPHGRVEVQLFHRGDLVKSKTVGINDGDFTARFGRESDRGLWTAEATFLGNDNFRRSSGSDDFRVRR
jgi:hypothetical protein